MGSKKTVLTAFRINTSWGRPHFAQFWCNVTPFRINTCKSVSKQTTLTSFRMNTYEKTGGWGYLRSTVPSIFRTLFQLPSSVSRNPFVCRSYETPGVWGNSSHFGIRYSLLHDRRCSAAALQHSARRGGFFADIAHSNDARRGPAAPGARDVADFFALQRQRSAPVRHNLAGKSQPDTLAVDLAAGAHALDDFLARVAAFGIADVAVLQTGLVRDLF